MKDIAHFTDEELKLELESREKIAYEKAIEKLSLDYAKRKKKVSKIEKKFNEEMKLFHNSLKEPDELYSQAAKLTLEVAEKYGFPVKIDNDTYWPKSVVKWKDDSIFSKEELDWLDEQFANMAGYPNTKPGEYWSPSSYSCY